jgi:hypothetical protein
MRVILRRKTHRERRLRAYYKEQQKKQKERDRETERE